MNKPKTGCDCFYCGQCLQTISLRPIACGDGRVYCSDGCESQDNHDTRRHETELRLLLNSQYTF